MGGVSIKFGAGMFRVGADELSNPDCQKISEISTLQCWMQGSNLHHRGGWPPGPAVYGSKSTICWQSEVRKSNLQTSAYVLPSFKVWRSLVRKLELV